MRQNAPASLDSIPVGGLRIAGEPESLDVWLENWEMVAISEYMPRQPDVQEQTWPANGRKGKARRQKTNNRGMPNIEIQLSAFVAIKHV